MPGDYVKVRAGNRVLQFHSDNFERIDITAFTTEVTARSVRAN